jgi:hypothetical protein
LPLLVTHVRGPATVCRQALPTTPTGQYLPAAEGSAVFEADAEDRRFVRPLPWCAMNNPFPTNLALMALGALTGSMLVVLIPGLLAWWAVRRRSWLLGILPVLWLGLPWLLVSLPISNKPAPHMPVLLVIIGLAGVPLLVFLGLALSWVWRRRWRKFGLLLGLSIGFAVLAAAVWLWYDGIGQTPWARYSWNGWYMAWLLGAYGAGMLMTLLLVYRAAARTLRWT